MNLLNLNKVRQYINSTVSNRDPHLVNVGADLGLQSGDDLSKAVNKHLTKDGEDCYRYVLPGGTYMWSEVVKCHKYDRIEFVGEPSATVKVEDPALHRMLELSGGPGGSQQGYANGFVWDGIDIDITYKGVGPNPIYATADREVTLRNFEVRGKMDYVEGAGVYCLHPTVASRRGTLTIENVSLPDGSYYHEKRRQVHHPIGVAIEKDNRGSVTIEDCYVSSFVNNGIYAATGRGFHGQGRILNCVAENNGNSQIRVGDNYEVTNCRIDITDDIKEGVVPTGFYVDGANGTTVTNLKVRCTHPTNDAVRVSGSTGNPHTRRVYFSGLTIISDQGGPVDGNRTLINVCGDGENDNKVVFENFALVDAGGGNARRGHPAVVFAENRPNITFRDGEVSTETEARHAFRFINCEKNIRLIDCDVTTKGAKACPVMCSEKNGAVEVRGGDYDTKRGSVVEDDSNIVTDSFAKITVE